MAIVVIPIAPNLIPPILHAPAIISIMILIPAPDHRRQHRQTRNHHNRFHTAPQYPKSECPEISTLKLPNPGHPGSGSRAGSLIIQLAAFATTEPAISSRTANPVPAEPQRPQREFPNVPASRTPVAVRPH